MGVEYLKNSLSIIDFILGLYRVDQRVIFYKRTEFLFDEDDFVDPAEIREDVVDAIVVILLGYRPHE